MSYDDFAWVSLHRDKRSEITIVSAVRMPWRDITSLYRVWNTCILGDLTYMVSTKSVAFILCRFRKYWVKSSGESNEVILHPQHRWKCRRKRIVLEHMIRAMENLRTLAIENYFIPESTWHSRVHWWSVPNTDSALNVTPIYSQVI